MNREQVMAEAREKGLVVEPCRASNMIAVRSSAVPPGTNERMRLTAEGAFLTVADGYYWQIGTVEDVHNYLKSLQ